MKSADAEQRESGGSRLFFVINQDVLDGSAHAIYCFRNAWWLAKAAPTCHVELIVPGKANLTAALRQFDLPDLPNFQMVGLPAIRKPRHGRGLTANLVFYLAAASYLRRNSKQNEFLLSGSFTKLFRFLQCRRELRQRLRFVYEVHQLAVLDEGKLTNKGEAEFAMLRGNDGLLTSSAVLEPILRRNGVNRPILNAGLACGFEPDNFPACERKQPFVLGYIGSVYREQGVEWLIEHWAEVANKQARPVKLDIAGGSKAEVEKLQGLAQIKPIQHRVSLHGFVAPSELRPWIANVDALIIPSLPEGRMPYVAITKAYDYLGLNRPVIAANLPTICEVMRPGVDALTFEAGQWESLSETLARLLGETTLQRTLVENASRRALEFSWGQRARRIWKFLNSTFPAGTKAV